MSIEFSLMSRCFLTLHVCVMVDYAGLSSGSTQTPAKEGVILLGAKSHLIVKHSVLTTHLSALLNSACRALSQQLLIHWDCLASLEIMISLSDKLLGPSRSKAGHKCQRLWWLGDFVWCSGSCEPSWAALLESKMWGILRTNGASGLSFYTFHILCCFSL